MGGRLRTELTHDPHGTGWLSSFDKSSGSQLHWGQVVDFIPFANAYRVCGGPRSYLWCSDSATAGYAPFGARQINTIPIGSLVFYIVHPQVPWWGIIVAVQPTPMVDSTYYRADYISPGSHSGIRVDKAHQLSISSMLDASGVLNSSLGRPLDQTSSGEWGAMTESGIAFFLDTFMAFMRVDEETGLFLFLHDALARLAGHNLQIRSSVGEQEDLDDEGEIIRFAGSALHKFEALGLWERSSSTDLHRTYTQEEVQGSKTEFNVLEPKYDDQQPFYRLYEAVGGYLGQGWRKTLCLPPVSPSLPVNRYQDHIIHQGVFEESLAASGAYCLRSAHHLIFSKRPLIPIPKMVTRPEDSNGASKDGGYKASGGYYEDPPTDSHKVKDQPAIPSSSVPANLIRASAVLDLGAFDFNWGATLHPYFYKSDYYLPEETALPLLQDWTLPTFAGLSSAQYLLPPGAIPLKVDHRYGNASYVPNEAVIALLPDGGILLRDGFGSQILMTGGTIKIEAAGDIWQQAGKNINQYAGWDLVSRAYNSADITASRKDVHIKAEHNVMVLGGNDGCGGVLVESRAVCPSYDYGGGKLGEDVIQGGILLKSSSAQVVAWGRDVLIWADPRESVTAKAHIVLDSGNRIKCYCDYFERYLREAGYDYFMEDGDTEARNTNEYFDNGTLFGGDVRVAGNLQTSKCLWVNGTVSVTQGHILTENAEDYRHLVAELTGADLANAQSLADDTTDREQTLNASTAPPEYDKTWRDILWAAINPATFSLRTMAQYRTNGLVLMETAWQQLARLAGESLPLWTEPVVTASGSDTYPHPGKEPWIVQSDFYTEDLDLYEFITGQGHSKSRAANQSHYETPAYIAPTARVMSSNYRIIRSS